MLVSIERLVIVRLVLCISFYEFCAENIIGIEIETFAALLRVVHVHFGVKFGIIRL